ncbi:MAG: CARDB domain-containing protein [Dehalococcoidales bacterium]
MKNKRYSKIVVIFALILVITTSLWIALPATPCYAQSGYAILETGEAGAPPPPDLTLLGNKIDAQGVMTNDVTAKSGDGACQLTITKGTEALDRFGEPLTGIIMATMKEPPEAPADSSLVSNVYNLEPDGATFDPPITLTFNYSQGDVPKGAAEGALVIAFWDEDRGEWVVLEDVTVDPVANTISAPVSHFTGFTIMASTRPAAFTASDLTITPTEVDIAQSVTISATATNTGDLAGSYDVTLKINGKVVSTKKVTLAGQASGQVTFTTIQGAPGTYAVNIDGLSGTFTVKSPPPVVIKQPPAPAPAPAPPAPAPAPPAPAPPAPAPAPEVNVWLLVIIAAATIIVVGVVIWLFAFRSEY